MGPSVSPLGALVDEIREEQLKKRSSDKRQPAELQLRALPPGIPEPELQLETGIVTQPSDRWLLTSRRLLVSLSLHAGLLPAVVLVPLLRSEPLPPPASATKAFFAEPVFSAPPPPPPPAASAPAVRQPRSQATPPPASTVTAPIETPDQIKPEESADIGLPQGQPGGVEGGVPGGLVGAVITPLPEPSAPPKRDPVRVGLNVKEPTKLKHVEPVYPDIAQRANVQGFVILECIVSPAGRITDVKVLRGIPVLNTAALDAVKQWTYKPTLLEGVPVSVVMTVTVQFRLVDVRREEL